MVKAACSDSRRLRFVFCTYSIAGLCWSINKFCKKKSANILNKLFCATFLWRQAYLHCSLENSTLEWIRCVPSGAHLIHWTCAVFFNIARKINNVGFFSRDQGYGITAIQCNSNHRKECDMGWYRYTSQSKDHCRLNSALVKSFVLWQVHCRKRSSSCDRRWMLSLSW